MMRTKVVGLTAVALLAFSGTALAAGFNAGQLQAVLDRAQKAAPPVTPMIGPPRLQKPTPTSGGELTGQGLAPTAVGGYVGYGWQAFGVGGNISKGTFPNTFRVFVAQSETPAQATAAWQATEAAVTSVPLLAGQSPATNFVTRTIKGHPVNFYDQAGTGTLNGQPKPVWTAYAAVADGRHLLQLSVEGKVGEDDPAKARAKVRRWVTRYLR